jgi:hypothetical protein
MRSRLSVFLNDLALDEILYLEEELDRRKEKHRRNYAVLSVQTDRALLRADSMGELGGFTREMRRYISSSAAAGGGTLLAYSPEVSVLLFNSVTGAGKTCAALLSGLPEFNGAQARQSMRIGLKLGLASGTDTLAPGSPRCVRSSHLVQRANQSAWRATVNTLLMDENSFQEWPEKFTVVQVPFDLDGQRMYRVVPGMLGADNGKYDNDALMRFLRQVADAGVQILKYDSERVDSDHADTITPGRVGEVMRLIFEAYDPHRGGNLTFKEKIAMADFGDRVEMIKRALSTMGLALMRHELSASSGV